MNTLNLMWFLLLVGCAISLKKKKPDCLVSLHELVFACHYLQQHKSDTTGIELALTSLTLLVAFLRVDTRNSLRRRSVALFQYTDTSCQLLHSGTLMKRSGKGLGSCAHHNGVCY